jgi:hypothetical protein
VNLETWTPLALLSVIHLLKNKQSCLPARIPAIQTSNQPILYLTATKAEGRKEMALPGGLISSKKELNGEGVMIRDCE